MVSLISSYLFCRWADDLYLLYGSFYSGPDTLFVSGDSMGNHACAQGMTKELQEAFKLWLATRQVKHSYDLEVSANWLPCKCVH